MKFFLFRYQIRRIIISCSAILIFLLFNSAFTDPLLQKGVLKINFINIADGRLVTLTDSLFTNPSREQYSITKLRYYISNFKLEGNKKPEDADNYQLIDLAVSTGFYLPVNKGSYSRIDFFLGLDSAKNYSGAQEGVLDPMRDMFWTWNTGYVIFKLEGSSIHSSADRQRIEHHIGGYRFGNNVTTKISLELDPPLIINNSDTAELNIYVDLDKYWNHVNNIRVTETPVITLPGQAAKAVAANFPGMFSVKMGKK